MPVSPHYVENLSATVVGLYQDAERLLLDRIARALAADIDAPDWAERKLLQVQLLQAQTGQQLHALTGRSAEEIAAAVLKAYNRGTATAQADLADLIAGSLGPNTIPPGLPAVEALVTEAVGKLDATHGQILRTIPDVFRDVIAQSAPQVLLGTQTRRDAAQTALDRFANRGVSGFIDRAGRNWALESYTEMSLRASTMSAAVQGHTDRLQAAGHDLVIVSNAPQECSLCRPFEGKVLSLSGLPRADRVDVMTTLADAKQRGLFHPSCRHSVGIYIPGVTKAPKHTADVEGSAARERLRSLERSVRKWKRRELVGLDDAAKAKAAAKVRAYQVAIREHVGSTSAKRQPARERLGAL
jgi:hypothetical protein